MCNRFFFAVPKVGAVVGVVGDDCPQLFGAGGGVYVDDFLYDLSKDPYELNNLVGNKDYDEIRDQMADLLARQMEKAGEPVPEILRSL